MIHRRPRACALALALAAAATAAAATATAATAAPAPRLRRPLPPFSAIDPAFTPYTIDGAVNYAAIPAMAAIAARAGVDVLLLGGSNGEWPSLTLDERLRLLAAWRAALDGLPSNASSPAPLLMFHVGSTALADAVALAAAAEAARADLILSIAPGVVFGGAATSASTVVANLAAISAAAPRTPLVYYHYPAIYAVDVSIAALVAAAKNSSVAGGPPEGDAVRTLAGVKYIDTQLVDLAVAQAASAAHGLGVAFYPQLPVVLAAAPLGAAGTPCFTPFAGLAKAVPAALARGDVPAAAAAMARVMELSRILAVYGGTPGGRAIYEHVYGLALGAVRAPQADLDPATVAAMLAELRAAGLL